MVSGQFQAVACGLVRRGRIFLLAGYPSRPYDPVKAWYAQAPPFEEWLDDH